MLRVAIVHYHLHTGGVTRVIQHAVSVLQARGVAVVVLSSAPPDTPLPCDVRIVEGLAYEHRRPDITARQLTADMLRTATAALEGVPDIWHVHNHSLGKNLLLPQCVRQLADTGHHLLLQLHDFPEDGRPDNYRRLRAQLGRDDPACLSRELYPVAGHVHYAVLNGRDRAALGAAGAPERLVHDLPNAVDLGPDALPAPPGKPDGTRLWLYPTRAIRRKNLGEFLLWACLSRAPDRFATTRGPRNPAERPRYEQWRGFARSLDLPVDFELGEQCEDFGTLLASAHTMVTTSVAEGFGLAFLEPWLLHKPIAGRDLPELTGDFRAEGVDLDALYERLDVPREWFDAGDLRHRIAHALEAVMGSYGRQPGARDTERALEAWSCAGAIDFGRLDEELQQQVIRRLAGSEQSRGEIRPQALAGPGTLAGDTVARNRRIVAGRYSLEAYGARLMRAYAALADSPTDKAPGALDGERLLDRFLAPERLYLLRT